MARNARLRLAEYRDELADRQFGLAEEANEAQPGNLARSLKTRKQGSET